MRAYVKLFIIGNPNENIAVTGLASGSKFGYLGCDATQEDTKLDASANH
jgi:hypothetical protein